MIRQRKARSIWEATDARRLNGPGGFTDLRTYKGNIRASLIFCAFFPVGWYFHDIFQWMYALFGADFVIDAGQQSWARLWAVIISGGGIATSILAMIMIPIRRRWARQSAEGQWYDRPDLTREALHEDVGAPAPEAKRKVRPESPEPDGYWKEESTPTHLVVESPPPKDATDSTRLERRDGRAVLVVRASSSTPKDPA